MSLKLHYHPLSSSCWKVLIALYESGIPFESRFLDLGDARQRQEFLALWPTGKMPLLVDGDRVVPETSIIVEYLSLHYVQPGHGLFAVEGDAALEVRLMDRVLDLYVMMPMQAIVGDRLRGEPDRDPTGVAKARDTLAMAYGLLEQKLNARPWMAGAHFSMADCTAAPALFYATTLVPLSAAHLRLRDYIDRVLQRPSVARVLDEAKPYFRYYPFREALPAQFLPTAGG